MPLKKGSAVLASIEATVTRARAAKHKKIQAQVNKHLTAARDAGEAARAEGHRGRQLAHAGVRQDQEAKAATLKKQLPPGYAMVFGKLRRITSGKQRPNRLSPK
jgi:hypothetical protein